MKVIVMQSAAKRGIGYMNALVNKGIKRNKFEIPVNTFLAQVPEKQQEAAKALLGNADRVVCSAKANNNGNGFSILGFIAKKGDKSVGKGAVSVSQFGTPEAAVKWRFGSKDLQTNGFWKDCDEPNLLLEQNSKGLSINGNMRFNFCDPNLAEANVSVNPQKALDLKNLFDSLVSKFGFKSFKAPFIKDKIGPYQIIA